MPTYDHSIYATRSDKELDERAAAKEAELAEIFAAAGVRPRGPKVIILGCPDRRMIPAYIALFRKQFGAEPELAVIDVETEHLLGIHNVTQHDATETLPGAPYDLVYSHVLLKFISQEKHFAVLKNSYDALEAGGMAIHIFDEDEVTSIPDVLADGWNAVRLEQLCGELSKAGIRHSVVDFDLSRAVGSLVARGVKGKALLIFR